MRISDWSSDVCSSDLALRFVQKSVFAAERVLLGNTRDRERLTWEAGEQDVVIRNLIGVDRRDIAMWRMIVAEVGRIGLLRELVPLRGEHAVSPDRVEAFANAANASEQVDEVKPTCSLFRSGGRSKERRVGKGGGS